MSPSDRLKRTPDTFRQLTGLTPAAFDPLLGQLAPRYLAAEARRKDRPGRRRKPGAGRKHTLSLADRLLMLLLYYRTYVSHAFLGFLFGLDDSAVGRNINPLQPLLAGTFRTPERRVELQPDEVRALFFDATGRPTRRPRRRQRRCCSGKKKRHTLKNRVVVARKRKRAGRRRAGQAQGRRLRIAAVSPTAPGEDARQEGVRPHAGAGAGGGGGVGGHRLPGDGAAHAGEEEARRVADRPAAARQPPPEPPADRG